MNKKDILIKYYEAFNEDDSVDFREYYSYVSNYEEYFFDLILIFYLYDIPLCSLDNYFRQGITMIKMYEAHNLILSMPITDDKYIKIINSLEKKINQKVLIKKKK